MELLNKMEKLITKEIYLYLELYLFIGYYFYFILQNNSKDDENYSYFFGRFIMTN